MTQTCICSEGIFPIPDNARAQTINIITLASGQAINISRDWPPSGVNFDRYLQGQIEILKSKCKNYEQISLLTPEPTTVFSKIAKLAFSFMPAEGITCWQYIVLAEKSPGHIMLFSSLFKDTALLEPGSAKVNELFESFRAH